MDVKKQNDSNKGHIKDLRVSIGFNSHIRDNSNLVLAHKKTERLIAATYLVTDLFDDREPLKWELRKRSVELLSFISSLPLRMYSAHEDRPIVALHDALAEILFPLELALRVRLISFMNFSILRDEYCSLDPLIRGAFDGEYLMNDFVFPQNFFAHDDTSATLPARIDRYRSDHSNKGQNNPPSDVGLKDKKESILSPIAKKDIIEERKKGQSKDIVGTEEKMKTISHNKQYDPVKDNRRSSIIRLLKTRGELTIRALSSVITGCSEKTIQRELTSLIEEGVIHKRGERRWSTYRIAS